MRGWAHVLTPRQQANDDGGSQGMVTAETAVVLPVLVLLLALLLGVLGHALDYVRSTDAARSAARMAARGEPVSTTERQALSEAPAGSSVSVQSDGMHVQVTIRAPARHLLGPITLPAAEATAVALVELVSSPS